MITRWGHFAATQLHDDVTRDAYMRLGVRQQMHVRALEPGSLSMWETAQRRRNDGQNDVAEALERAAFSTIGVV
ncbi:UNVERIFIED_CONTAM: hypothetical protein RF648_22275, partial [Kocuria sp. CPCC 205274]